MEEQLKYYEVIMGLMGVISKTSNLNDRSVLYCCVRNLDDVKKEDLPSFNFRNRTGVLTSSDVDIGIRNLIDCEMITLVNYSKVVLTDRGRMFYKLRIKPELKRRGLLEDFEIAGKVITEKL